MAREKLSHHQQAFEIQNAIRIAVSTAQQRGIAVDLSVVTAILTNAFPDAAGAPEVVQLALKNAAENARVPVRNGSIREGAILVSKAA